VQNLMVMRFANTMFEPIWNYKYIDHVQITVSETLASAVAAALRQERRAARHGAEPHLSAHGAGAMEPPVALDARSIRDEKVKVFKSIRRCATHRRSRRQRRPGIHRRRRSKDRTEGLTKRRVSTQIRKPRPLSR